MKTEEKKTVIKKHDKGFYIGIIMLVAIIVIATLAVSTFWW